MESIWNLLANFLPILIQKELKAVGIDRANVLKRSKKQNFPSLHSKRFRLVSEQRKTEERDSRFWPREK